MATVRIRQEEMQVLREAANRLERRSNSRFVLDQSRVEVSEDSADSNLPSPTGSNRTISCD